nr:ribulose phosphate epimerase [Vibrio sp. Evd11]
MNESGRNVCLDVDGGVKVNNIKEIAEAGADLFAASSTIFDSEDFQQAIDLMRAELAQLN